MPAAIRPGLTLRDAVLNSSAWPVECLGRGTVLQVGGAQHKGGEEAADADDEAVAVAGAGGEHLDAGGGRHCRGDGLCYGCM